MDNTQYLFAATDGTYYARCRAYGPDWYRSSWTTWLAFQVTSAGIGLVIDHGGLTGLGDDDHTQYVLADGTRDLAYAPGEASDWPAGDPGDTDDALDKLAERVKDLEDTPSTGDASDTTYTPADATDWDGDADPGNVDDALDQLAERIPLRASDLATYMEPLTNGVASDPELVFAGGDVIMVEVYFDPAYPYNNVLAEDGDYLLLEDGGYLLLEA